MTRDLPDHKFLLPSDVNTGHAHSEPHHSEMLALELIQVDGVMGVPEVP